MSDRDINDLRERMVAVETTLHELPSVRSRVHDLVQCTQQLVSASEHAAEQRAALAEKFDNLGGKMETATLTAATAMASIQAAFSGHVDQCKADKAEIRALIAGTLSTQAGQHSENQAKLDAQQIRLTRLEVRMAAYAGAAVVLTWLFSHGLELIEKLFKD